MRRRRAIICNDDPRAMNALMQFFQTRGYETLIFREPTICPVYADLEDCPGPHSCGDIVILSYNTPVINGVDLLTAQQKRRCRLSARNKAVVAASLPAEGRAALAELGAAFLQYPLNYDELEKWVADCETRINLDRPVAVKRREGREASYYERLSFYLADDSIERVSVVNKSSCGVCFRTSQRLTANQTITLREDSRGITEDGVVRWVKTDEKGTFLVGLSLCV